MTKVLFVETTTSLMETRACEIAEHLYVKGHSLQIIAVDDYQAKRLDDLLWSFRPDSFIPHGFCTGSANAVEQPVVITTKKERLKKIPVLLMMDCLETALVKQFSFAVHLIAVDNSERLAASRAYWAQLKEAGFMLRHQKR
jgi:DNA polymerase-3 subunit chi